MPLADLLFACMPCLGAPPPPRLKLHVDADRNGAVDNGYANVHQWTWGAAGRGAVILCNNDDDDGSRTIAPLAAGRATTLEIPTAANGLDNTGAAIDGVNDVADIAQLEIRRHPAVRAFGAGWSGRLSVAAGMQQRIRIFNARAAGAPEVLGPAAGPVYAIPGLAGAPAVLSLGMEALQYPDLNFEGFIDLTLETLDAAGLVQHTHVARVRVAPWLAMHHLQPVREVFVLNDGVNLGHNVFRGDLTAVVTSVGGIPAPTMANNMNYDGDRWFRDVMKIGFSSMPTPGAANTWHLPAALRTANNRLLSHNSLLDRFAWRELVGQQMGFVSPQPHPFLNGSSLDSFGNLECSPPVTVNGRNYRFGRIVYGHDPGSADRMSVRVRNFLDGQKVQHPFYVNTGWLDVGHVDEVFSFCPWPGSAKGFKLLIASPDVALQIIFNAAVAGNGAAPLCVAPQANAVLWAGINGVYPHLTVNAVLGDGPFVAHQGVVQVHIDGMEAVLTAELGLDPADIIKLPVLYSDLGGGKSVAYMPNAANMLVATRPDGWANLCVPKPFGPVVGGNCLFEADIAAKLNPEYRLPGAALPNKGRLYFIDDFFTYHDLMGEIHCGTNEIRTPPANPWWWHLDWVV